MRILVMAGGTGGHIFPALAVAKELIAAGDSVEWLGAYGGLEEDIVPKNNIVLNLVHMKGIRGKGKLSLLSAPFKVLRAMYESFKILKKYKPDVVLGMGGYVTGPCGLCAWMFGKKLIIHEQNAIAGLTNKLLARFSHTVLEAFPKSFAKDNFAHLTGNPVRKELLSLPPPSVRLNDNGLFNRDKLRILVLGGSKGAKAINEIIPKMVKLWPKEYGLSIWHQAGSTHLAEAFNLYDDYSGGGIEISVAPFIDDMASAYAFADVVICRSGALTIAEIAAVGVASILIPYPYAVDNHQVANANYLVDNNAALLIEQKDLTAKGLVQSLLELNADRTKILTMAQNAYSLAKPEAVTSVLQSIKGQ